MIMPFQRQNLSVGLRVNDVVMLMVIVRQHQPLAALENRRIPMIDGRHSERVEAGSIRRHPAEDLAVNEAIMAAQKGFIFILHEVDRSRIIVEQVIAGGCTCTVQARRCMEGGELELVGEGEMEVGGAMVVGVRERRRHADVGLGKEERGGGGGGGRGGRGLLRGDFLVFTAAAANGDVA